MPPGLKYSGKQKRAGAPHGGDQGHRAGTAHSSGEENHMTQEKNSHLVDSLAKSKKNLKLWELTVDILLS